MSRRRRHRRRLPATALAVLTALAVGSGLSGGGSSQAAPSAGVGPAAPGGHRLDAGTSGAATYRADTAAARHGAHRRYVKLDLLALNDFHGNLEPPTGSSGRINNTPAGGVAALASLLHHQRRASRAAGATPLTVAAGDLIGASPLLSAAFHDEPTIKAMNKIGLQASSVGNHEFDEGVGELQRMQSGGCLPDGPNGAGGANSCPGGHGFKGARFPYLAANTFWNDPGAHRRPTVFKPYQIFRVQGQKVAFIGMTLAGTASIVSQAGIADVHFADEVATANALVPKLRKKGVRSIVVLLHQGVTPADQTAYDSCTGVVGPALEIAERLSPAIDAVVSGHTHQAYNCVVPDPKGRPRLLTSASSFGRMVTKLHLLIDPRTHDIVRPAAYAENIVNASGAGQPTSARLNHLVSIYQRLVQPIANAVIGHVTGAAVVSRTADANGGDSALGNLIADSQRADPTVVSDGTAPVIALMNPGGIRADLVAGADGAITYGAAFTVQPFNNFMVSMDLTGAQIRTILNQQWNGANEAGASGTKILQVAGLRYTWDASQAASSAPDALVGDVLVDADADPATAMVPLVDTQTYRVVANNFLSDGGDNFAGFTAGTDKLVGGLDIDALRVYLQGHDPVAPTTTDRISQQP